ncbi:AI-2E family transporter [Prosthecobacter sp.]|uniref:AI-2E family transporter n=1 Tax=Prosthecobacter sp. TaxID=1965333 RepID=UPI003782EE14
MDTFNRTLTHFLKFFSALLVIATLYLGRDILIPLALASLFTFLLNPMVKRLCRWGIPRMLSLGIVTVACFSTLAMVAWLLGGELASLAKDLPNHQQNIQRHVDSFKKLGDNREIQRLRQMVGDMSGGGGSQAGVSTTETGEEPATRPVGQAAPPPMPAPPPSGEPAMVKVLNMAVSTLADGLGMATVVILFVVFMLLRLNDISQRVARLVGYSRLTLTTKAMDESGDRISRYLLMQGSVNASYGMVLSLGLHVIGLPYVLLWGVLAAISRFIPYVGAWMVAALLVGLSLAMSDGWSQTLVVIGFIVTLELLTNMLVEPLLYGHSVGISDFALLLAIAFWTWIWGGVGLLLATPLTVCFVVFCKHAPSFEWVDILMGENPLPQPHLSYYQYQLAGNEDAAQELLEQSLRKDGLDATMDGIALPALALTRREEVLGKLDTDEAEEIYAGMRSSSALLRVEAEEAMEKEQKKKDVSKDGETVRSNAPVVNVYGRALHGEPDAQALEMLALMLPEGLALEVAAEPRLIGELVKELEAKKPAAVCISALPLRAQLDAKTLCRRLRGKLPELKILVCHWTLPGQEPSDPKPLREAGATWVASSLKEAREILARLLA